jgi:hypothetical protein
VENISSAAQVTSWLLTGRSLFLLLHVLGVAIFFYIVAKRLVPLLQEPFTFSFLPASYFWPFALSRC